MGFCMHAVVPLPLPSAVGATAHLANRIEVARAAAVGVVPASRLEVRPAPAVVSTGIAPLDALTGGLPRGALTEIWGAASSGRTSVLVSVLAAMTARGELCALVDAGDSFAPGTARAAGVELTRLLWVRCGNPVSSFQLAVSSKNPPPRRLQLGSENRFFGSRVPVPNDGPSTRSWKTETKNFDRLEHALKATDLLLQSGGFGLVAIDLGDVAPEAARRVPLTSWFRFRRAVENTPTVLLLLARNSCAKTCASVVLRLRGLPASGRLRPAEELPTAGNELRLASSGLSPASGARSPSHAELLTGISTEVELVRSRAERKPVCTSTAVFDTRAEWA